MSKLSFLTNLLDHAPEHRECTKCRFYLSKQQYMITPCKRCVLNGGDVTPDHLKQPKN
ncbi:MAG TPA: hypothetical protein P5191_16820 [Ruminococcus sp.]|nr:hypothetical protein [Ruminococcus sp.]